jgi:quercetin dioxygenase-like cupin family protein
MSELRAIGAPGRDLTVEELRDTVACLGRKPWPDLCLDVDAERSYQELFRTPEGTGDERLSTWLIHWGKSADTGFHDHDLSLGAVHVIRGRVRDERLRLGGAPEAKEHGPGETFTIGAADIHRVTHVGDEPALTVHGYSPPLLRMGAYMVEPDGTLTRHAISYESKLRPLETL